MYMNDMTMLMPIQDKTRKRNEERKNGGNGCEYRMSRRKGEAQGPACRLG
jgi:hypothetical protein